MANILTNSNGTHVNGTHVKNYTARIDATLSRLEKTQQSILDMLSKNGSKQVKGDFCKKENSQETVVSSESTESVACGQGMNAVKILHKSNYR